MTAKSDEAQRRIMRQQSERLTDLVGREKRENESKAAAIILVIMLVVLAVSILIIVGYSAFIGQPIV